MPAVVFKQYSFTLLVVFFSVKQEGVKSLPVAVTLDFTSFYQGYNRW